MIATELTDKLLAEIEEKSNVTWVGGLRLSDFIPPGYASWLYLSGNDDNTALSFGTETPPLGQFIASAAEFVAACVAAKPKTKEGQGDKVIYTELKEEVLYKIEAGSEVRWSSGVQPTHFSPIGTWLVLRYESLSYGSFSLDTPPDTYFPQARLVSAEEFVQACVELKPKYDCPSIPSRIDDIVFESMGRQERVVDFEKSCEVHHVSRSCSCIRYVDANAIDSIQPKIETPCPHSERLGLWLTQDRRIREVGWVGGFWRIYSKTTDYNPIRVDLREASWAIPTNWVRPTNGPRLLRPKPRSRINIGWDPEDVG